MSQITQEQVCGNESAGPRIQVNGLHIQRQLKTIVNQVSFEVLAGEVLGLVGPNGAGKSTILASLAGIVTPDRGTIDIDGKNLLSLSTTERTQTIAWVEQVGEIHWPLSVEQIVMLGRLPHQTNWNSPSSDDSDALELALEQADCQRIRHQKITTLSGGERARVLLARAIASQPSVLLADEPVASLDLAHQLQTMQLLRNHATANQATVVVLHDLSLAARYCDRLVLLHEGKCIAIGEPAAVLTNQNIADVYGVSVIMGCGSVPWIVPENLLGI